MTTEDVLAMEAGRKLDVLVAEKVMQWQRWTCSDYRFAVSVLFEPGFYLRASWRRCGPEIPLDPNGGTLTPLYSAGIAAAWQVIGALRLKKFAVVIEDWGEDGWAVYFITADGGTTRQVVATTLPLAVCQAALIAKLSWRAVA